MPFAPAGASAAGSQQSSDETSVETAEVSDVTPGSPAARAVSEPASAVSDVHADESAGGLDAWSDPAGPCRPWRSSRPQLEELLVGALDP